MDNIERLLSQADPAKTEDIGGPGALILEDPVPVFSQTHPAAHRPKKTVRWQLFAASTAVAALAVGIFVWSPWNAPAPGPALPAGPLPTPTPSSSIDDLSHLLTDKGLPNFLVPASQQTYFEDSAACNALDPATIQLRSETGALGTLPGGAPNYPVIGCANGTATFMTADRARAVSAETEMIPQGIMVARWKDSVWSIEISEASTRDDEFFTWPEMRAQSGIEVAETYMATQLRWMGIDEADAQVLLGPNVPSWMGQKPSDEFLDYGNTLLSFSHPEWELREKMLDEQEKPIIESKGVDPRDAALYELLGFDSRGKQVLYLTSTKKGLVFEPRRDCATDGTYRLDDESPSAVVADSGPLKLAIITTQPTVGAEYSFVGLVPEDLPASGNRCEVRIGVDIKDRTWQVTEMLGPLGFADQVERDAYLTSPEYLDVKKFAASLELGTTGQ